MMPRVTAKAGKYPKAQPIDTIWARSANGLEYDISGGWHQPREEGWWNKAEREAINLYDLKGKKHKMYQYRLPDTIVGFTAHEGDNAERQMLLADAEAAFKDPDNVEKEEGCGHILLVEFAIAERILRVTFKRGDIVVYRNIPTYVAGTLLHWARTKQLAVSGDRHYKYGREKRDRHQLGVSFWELIRIKGRQIGSKFPFEYVTHSTYHIISKKGRHLVRGEDGTNYLYNFSEDEFALYNEIKDLVQKAKELNYRSSATTQQQDNDDNGDNSVESEYAIQGSDSGLVRDVATTENAEDLQAEYVSILQKEALVDSSILGEILQRAKKHIEEILQTKLALSYGDMGTTADRNRFIKDYANTYPVLGLVNQKRTDLELKRPTSEAALVKNMDVLKEYDDKGVLSWLHKGDRTRHTVRKVWTPQMLTDFANPYIDGNISHGDAAKYKVYIDNKDWEGALNFLKARKHDNRIKDSKSGAVYPKEYKHYADRLDVLGSDEY